VLTEAFAHHPVLPRDTPPETRRALLELFIKTFAGSNRAWLHGIRRDGTLVCAAFSLDPRFKPGPKAMLRFFGGLLCLLGWRTGWEFMTSLSRRPKYDLPYLELLLLGTLPTFHGQGLGRTMLRFLYGFCGTLGYHGVILDVAQDTPAYEFYVREGFVVDGQITMNKMLLCHMRRADAERECTQESRGGATR